VAIGINERLDRPNLYYNIVQSKIGIKYPGRTPSPLDFLVTDWLDNPTEMPKTLIYFDSKTTLRHFRDRLRALLPLPLDRQTEKAYHPRVLLGSIV
jgi:hypothetical protein